MAKKMISCSWAGLALGGSLIYQPLLVLSACAKSGADEINSPELRKQVSGSAIRPESESTKEKIYFGKVLSAQGANLVVENNGQPLKVELKQVTPLKVGDRVQLRGTIIGDTLMAAGVRTDTQEP